MALVRRVSDGQVIDVGLGSLRSLLSEGLVEKLDDDKPAPKKKGRQQSESDDK